MISLILVLIVIGFLLYMFNRSVTAMDPRIKAAINCIVIFLAIMYLLLFVPDLFGVYNNPIKL